MQQWAGYGGQQQGYGGQQQGYGGQQAGYGGQAVTTNQGYGAQNLWTVAFDNGRVYTLRNGEQQVLGRYDMTEQKLTVSREQCLVQIAEDGTATLLSCGKPPTGWREPGGAWLWLQPQETIVLAHGDQVSLDMQNPEGSVFSLQEEGGMGGGMGMGGGAQQQQGQGNSLVCVQASFDFLTPGQGELGFRAGDIIAVTQQGGPNEWWEGSLNGQVGWFPSNFCSEPFYS